METKQFCLFCMFLLLFLIIRSINAIVSGSNLLTFYENAANDFVAKHLSDTKFCDSVLLPTEITPKRLFESTFVTVKKGTYLNDSDHLDLCCRSLHKCEAHKHIEFNYTIEAYIRHCECEYLFQKCLENLNSSLSNELGFIHSLNTSKCYKIDYPIIKCVQFDPYRVDSEVTSNLQFLDSDEHKSLFDRCLKYDLDQSQPKKIQMFDVPFNNKMFAFKCKLSSKTNIMFYV